MLVSLMREIDKGRIAARQVLGEVVRDGEPAIPAAENTAKQHDPVGREPTQIQVVTATYAGEQAWRGSYALIDGRIAIAKARYHQVVLAAVTTWNAPMLAHREEDPAAGRAKLFRNLSARIPRTDDQNRAWRQRLRITIAAGMQMQRRAADRKRGHRSLERSGGDHHILRLERAVGVSTIRRVRVRRPAKRGCRQTARSGAWMNAA